MSYIGNTPTSQSFISGTDYFNGNGSTTAFTLTRTVGSVNDIEAVVENVVQRPNDAYTISGTTITFTSAPPSGTNNIYVRYLSTTTQSITPVQNSVSYATMNTDLQNQWGTGFKNRIINGDMQIDQRNAGASVTLTSGGIYTVDRWIGFENTDGAMTAQQSTAAPTGFINSLLFTTTTADSSLSSTQFSCLQQYIEGRNLTDLGWGTANAKTITISFWVRSSLTGTFGGALRNAAGDRTYPFTYTISAANTWEYETITIAGDTTGTWLTTNAIGVQVTFGLGVGTDLSGTAGSWSGNNNLSATGAVNVMGTLNATWQITGVQFEVGSTATSFDQLPYGTELQLCQRYFQKIGFGSGNGVAGIAVRETSNTAGIGFALPVALRTNPTMTVSGANRVWGAGGIITLASSIGSVSSNDSQTITNVYFTQTATGIVASEPYLLYIDAGNSYSLSAEL
jgi:hypothetical protein